VGRASKTVPNVRRWVDLPPREVAISEPLADAGEIHVEPVIQGPRHTSAEHRFCVEMAQIPFLRGCSQPWWGSPPPTTRFGFGDRFCRMTLPRRTRKMFSLRSLQSALFFARPLESFSLKILNDDPSQGVGRQYRLRGHPCIERIEIRVEPYRSAVRHFFVEDEFVRVQPGRCNDTTTACLQQTLDITEHQVPLVRLRAAPSAKSPDLEDRCIEFPRQ